MPNLEHCWNLAGTDRTVDRKRQIRRYAAVNIHHVSRGRRREYLGQP